jgi:hypothetical protein
MGLFQHLTKTQLFIQPGNPFRFIKKELNAYQGLSLVRGRTKLKYQFLMNNIQKEGLFEHYTVLFYPEK